MTIPSTYPNANGWYWASDQHVSGYFTDISYVQPGQIIQMNWGYGNPHTALVVATTSTGMSVVESNWIDDPGEGANHVDTRWISFATFRSNVGTYFAFYSIL